MTKTRTMLAISFAAFFAISMVMAPVYARGHVIVEKAEMTKHLKKGTLDLKIKVAAKIPKNELGLFGWGLFGWVNTLVAVTHVPAGDDSDFDKKKGAFHTHVLTLASDIVNCGDDLEIVGLTDPGYKNKVGKDKIKIKKVPLSDLGARIMADPIEVAGFKLSFSEVDDTKICLEKISPVTPKIKTKK